jgi:hypothetical protein
MLPSNNKTDGNMLREGSPPLRDRAGFKINPNLRTSRGQAAPALPRTSVLGTGTVRAGGFGWGLRWYALRWGLCIMNLVLHTWPIGPRPRRKNTAEGSPPLRSRAGFTINPNLRTPRGQAGSGRGRGDRLNRKPLGRQISIKYEN